VALMTGDPDALVKVGGQKDLPLEGWADNEHLQLLNLTYVLESQIAISLGTLCDFTLSM
jgi:hypothetical protein